MPSINIIFSYESPRKIVKHLYFAAYRNKLQPKILNILKAYPLVNNEYFKIFEEILVNSHYKKKIHLLVNDKCKTNLT